MNAHPPTRTIQLLAAALVAAAAAACSAGDTAAEAEEPPTETVEAEPTPERSYKGDWKDTIGDSTVPGCPRSATGSYC